MAEYRFRPDASCLHAKLIAEARELSLYFVMHATCGRPGHVTVRKYGARIRPLWSGHRDSLPHIYRFAHDPHGALKRPDSSD